MGSTQPQCLTQAKNHRFVNGCLLPGPLSDHPACPVCLSC
jgi:hypothetical protein